MLHVPLGACWAMIRRFTRASTTVTYIPPFDAWLYQTSVRRSLLCISRLTPFFGKEYFGNGRWLTGGWGFLASGAAGGVGIVRAEPSGHILLIVTVIYE